MQEMQATRAIEHLHRAISCGHFGPLSESERLALSIRAEAMRRTTGRPPDHPPPVVGPSSP